MREYPKDPDWDVSISKEQADYRVADNPDERCGLCSMFKPPSSCTLVEGEIKPEMVCDYFYRK